MGGWAGGHFEPTNDALQVPSLDFPKHALADETAKVLTEDQDLPVSIGQCGRNPGNTSTAAYK